MPKAESIFWGITLLAIGYLLSEGIAVQPTQVNAQYATTGTAAAPSSPSGGHYMPNGQWMEGDMGGMGCGMNSGGGCGCAGMRR